MNKSELKQKIIDEEMPASEIARWIDDLETCPFFMEEECGLAERCELDNVIPI